MFKEYRAGFLSLSVEFSDSWTTYIDNVQHTKKLSEAEFRKQYKELLEVFLKQPGMRGKYERLGGFYNSLGVCVRAGLCDFETSKALLGDEILTYYDNMYPHLQIVCQYSYDVDGIFYFIVRQNKDALDCKKKLSS